MKLRQLGSEQFTEHVAADDLCAWCDYVHHIVKPASNTTIELENDQGERRSVHCAAPGVYSCLPPEAAAPTSAADPSNEDEAAVFLQFLEVVIADYKAKRIGWSIASANGKVRATIVYAASADFPEGSTTIGEGPSLAAACKQLGENMVEQAMAGAPSA